MTKLKIRKIDDYSSTSEGDKGTGWKKFDKFYDVIGKHITPYWYLKEKNKKKKKKKSD